MNTSSSLKAALATAILLLASFPALAVDPVGSGRVVYSDGEITANGLVVDTGDLLTGAQIIKTGKKSVLEVVFADRNIFRVGPESVVKIDFSQTRKIVSLDKGEFTSVLKKLAQLTGDSSFVLKTPTVNAGVRGTSFHVTTDGTNSYFCTCNGSVDLDSGTPSDFVQLTNAHHGARIYTRQKDGSVVVTKAGLIGHTDASLETLGKRIGVGIDWTKPDLKHE